MNGELFKFPLPPSFSHTNIQVNKFFPWNHPCTKWILNTFRDGASTRLISMLREKPQLFQCLFQIPDCPRKVTWDQCDLEPMFKQSTVLYLRPLSLAVYMHRRTIVELLMESGYMDANEVSYATDTCSRSDQNMSTDILTIIPAVVAVRRNYFEVLPVICSKKHGKDKQTFASDRFKLHYVNKNAEKLIEYEDIFTYAIKLVNRNRLLHISKLFDILVLQCPRFFSRNFYHIFCQKHAMKKHSLFHRILILLLFKDTNCRLKLHLIHTIQRLVRLNLFYRPEYDRMFYSRLGNDGNKYEHSLELSHLSQTWCNFSFHIQDCLLSIACLFKILEVLLRKGKNCYILKIEDILLQTLSSLGCRNIIDNLSAERVQHILAFLLMKENERNQGCKYIDESILQAPNIETLDLILERLRKMRSELCTTYGRLNRQDCKISISCVELDDKECFFCLNDDESVHYDPEMSHKCMNSYKKINPKKYSVKNSDGDKKSPNILMDTRNLKAECRKKSIEEMRTHSTSISAEYKFTENKVSMRLMSKLINKRKSQKNQTQVDVANFSHLPLKKDFSDGKVNKFIAETYIESVPENVIEVKLQEERTQLRKSCVLKATELKVLTYELESSYNADFFPDPLTKHSPVQNIFSENGQVCLHEFDQLIEKIAAGTNSACSDEIPISELDSIFIDDILQECMGKQDKWLNNDDDIPLEYYDKIMTPLIRQSRLAAFDAHA